MNRSRRNRLVHLLAFAALATGVPLAAATPAGALVGSCDASFDKVWTGATGDGLWNTAGNWTDAEGDTGVPGPTDVVCVDTGAAGGVRAERGISIQGLTVAGTVDDPPVELSGTVDVERYLYGTGSVVLSGRVTFDVRRFSYGRLSIPAASVVTSDGTWTGGDFTSDPAGPLDLAGTLVVRGSMYLGDVRVRPGGSLTSAFGGRQELRVSGALDIDDGGTFVVSDGMFSTSASTTVVGNDPTLRDVEMVALAPIPLTITGDVMVHALRAGATVRVRPEGDRLSVGPRPGQFGDRPLDLDGTLDVAAVPAETANGLPYGPINVPILNRGTVRLDGVQLNADFDNRGTTSVRGVWSKPGRTFANWGRLEVGPRYGVGPLQPSFLVSGNLTGDGEIVSTDPTAEVTSGFTVGKGDVSTWLNVAGGESVVGAVPGRPRAVSVLGLGESAVVLELGGLTDAGASRVLVTKALVDFGSSIELNASIVPGYVPCAGARWQLVSWPKLLVGYRPPTANPSGNVPGVARSTPTLVTPGLPAGVQVVLRERADGWVAVAKGSPTGGAACSEPVGRRLVSGWYVDGLGRPATVAQLASFGDRASTASGRRSAARELLGGEAAVSRFVTTDLARILGRPASAAGVAAYVRRLRAGTEPDVMRAETYGGSGFWVSSGRTADGWTTALYRTELGRNPTAGELVARRRQFADGMSRAGVARYLLAGGEADRALAGRSVALWWGRGSSPSERSTWSVRYRSGPELAATADLAAANPIT